MQTHSPQISDIQDYITYLSVELDVNEDYIRLTLLEGSRDYDNGDLKDEQQLDFDTNLEFRHETELNRLAESYN